MNRRNAIWFVAGVATGSIAVAGSSFLMGPEPEWSWTLRVAEKTSSLDGAKIPEWVGARLARECGIKRFTMIPAVGVDSVDATRIELIKENNPSLGCVVERARDAGLWVGVQMENLHAQTH